MGRDEDGSSDVTQNYVTTFIPRIPINDFSYLGEIGLVPELATQESAMLHSSDFDDTTLPLVPSFLTKGPGAPVEAIPEMSIAPIGIADWVNTSGDTGGLSNVSGLEDVPYMRTLDDFYCAWTTLLCVITS